MNKLFCMLSEVDLWNGFLNFCETAVDWLQENWLKGLRIILFVLLGILIVKVISKILNKILYKTKMEHVIANYLITIIKIILYFTIVFSVLKMLSVDTTSLIALFTTISLALSLAMENIFSNLANGLIIIITKPFKENDWIAIGDYEGSVKAIKLLYTVLNTVDNKDINIPNSTFIGNELVNYNANPTRKYMKEFEVAYDTDIDKIKKVLMDCIESSDYAILDPKPLVRLKSFNQSSISVQVVVYCRTPDYWNLNYELIDKAFNEFKRENITIPFNQVEVRLLENDVVMPYRKEPLNKRTNNGIYIQKHKEDIFDKIGDTVSHKFRYKEKNTENAHKIESQKLELPNTETLELINTELQENNQNNDVK